MFMLFLNFLYSATLNSAQAYGFCGGNLGTATPTINASTVCCKFLMNLIFVLIAYIIISLFLSYS